MHSPISPNQAAFILCRAIQDNIVITHDTFHNLRTSKKANNHNMAVKLDMQKAYDRV